ncbi:hypothetical protein ESCO_003988 [Escovopsis weberi]|uniref:Uncharacterized protein n=1 Tax=Escovopsis weberi TaxID=150374 RepID=A0A0M8N941_ESCWE|nr:hypothetical protein ESCO_003988 [Escovopsis weberi]
MAPLRERIKMVSQKYETLHVLVSESNPSGEFTNSLSPSDAAAYADLVRFAVALNAGLNVVLVPGADATLAKWVLSLMCRYSDQTASLERFLSAKDSSWERFLRQAGFNVVAAKVLAGSLLEDAGPLGLARYIVTPAQERISRYAGVLGGEKVIRSSSERLDPGWG